MGIALVLSCGQAQFLSHHLQLVSQCPGLQWLVFLLGRSGRELASGLLHQLGGGDTLLFCRMVLHGQLGTPMDPLYHHDDGRHFLHLLHVCSLG